MLWLTHVEVGIGAHMCSPISGLIAEAVWKKRLEGNVFAAISPTFWKRYVDDTMQWYVDDYVRKPNAFHQILNAALPALTFPIEAPIENKIPHLDVLVHELPSGMLKTSVYRKGKNAEPHRKPKNGISELIARHLIRLNFNLAHKPTQSLRSTWLPSTEAMERSVQDTSSFVGQTGR